MDKKTAALIVGVVGAGVVVAVTATALILSKIDDKKEETTETTEFVTVAPEVNLTDKLSGHVGEIIIAGTALEYDIDNLLATVKPFVDSSTKAIYISDVSPDYDADTEGVNFTIYDGEFHQEYDYLSEESVELIDGFEVTKDVSNSINSME